MVLREVAPSVEEEPILVETLAVVNPHEMQISPIE
jgi:hypothetical protein